MATYSNKLGSGINLKRRDKSMLWRYEKYDDEFNRTNCPPHDADGSITGKVIINLSEWFDENPEERIRLGWIKHFYYAYEDIEKMFDPQTQFVEIATKMIDEYTIQDEIIIFQKTEDMFVDEELHGRNFIIGGLNFIV